MKITAPRVIRNWEHAKSVSPDFTVPFLYLGDSGRRNSRQGKPECWGLAFSAFGLVPTAVEPNYGNFLGNHFKDGAYVHEHTDGAPEGYAHVRCNLMLRKPDVGGNPVLDGEEVEVGEGDLWLCIASHEKHSSTPIQGGERLVFSFGGLVSVEQIERLKAL